METFNLSPSHPSWFISGSVPVQIYELTLQEAACCNTEFIIITEDVLNCNAIH